MHDQTAERMGMGTEVIYTGSAAGAPGATLHTHDESFVTRDWAGTYIEYQSEGDVGEVDLLTTINAVTNAFVLIGMATFVVDFIGHLLFILLRRQVRRRRRAADPGGHRRAPREPLAPGGSV